jgi:CRISPR/Cas system-associated exonuclease Cas4 (RecB family)
VKAATVPIAKDFNVSKSSLELYLDCPRRYWFLFNLKTPKKVDYPRLCGILVHEFVQGLYNHNATDRPFFFKKKVSALHRWWRIWHEEVEKNIAESKLTNASDENTKKYAGIGAACISNYWNGNVNAARPLEIEKKYTYCEGGIKLTGIFDQLRGVSLQWVAKRRPDIIMSGALHPAFSPVVVVDIKTERNSFDAERYKTGVTAEERNRLQFDLHEGIQPTMYTLLYELITGRKPVAFLWYHLLTGKWFVTWRTDDDYETLYDVIRHVRENLAVQSYPKHPGKRCRFCDFYEECHENRSFIMSHPETPEEDRRPELIPSKIMVDPTKQLRLKMTVARQKMSPLPKLTPPTRLTTLKDMPWSSGNASLFTVGGRKEGDANERHA